MKLKIFVSAVALLTIGCTSNSNTPEVADLVFTNAKVVTVDDNNPHAEAVAVRDGVIQAVGSNSRLRQLIGAGTEVIDLQGKTLTPGFIDSHSHFTHAVAMATWANVSPPPVGPAKDLASLIYALQQHEKAFPLKEDDWLMAYGYDENALGGHINRYDLDKHFPDTPVLLMHISGHGAMLNSAALALANITAESRTPEGGIIGRLPNSLEPNGLLMETAWIPLALKKLTEAQQNINQHFQLALERYARNGYTTIQDGAAQYSETKLYQTQAEAGHLYLDLVSLPVFLDLDKVLSDNSMRPGAYNHRLKLGGIKIVGDGSPQGKTAYMTEAFHVPGPDGQHNWHGEPMIPYEQFEKVFLSAHSAGWQIFIHANGDATADMVVRAHQKAGLSAQDNHRNVVIHSQFMRPDQLDSYAQLGISPSFFTNHAYYWGDAHIKNLGHTRANFLSPLKTAKAKGIRYSNHTDYIVTPLNPMMPLWTAVKRESRDGVIIGADERVSVYQALKAITIDAAYQYFEEDKKGSIEVGKLADLVVLSDNPLSANIDDIRHIEVLATYKEGQQVFSLDERHADLNKH
jgi:predicted amidohydrolase YtcJ